ncbi:MAG: SBBP repeat-containing protein, partial [Flavobacteriales bacterium]|nr:SBBP repeat-containing protein [Flavobacteriales bacterium]
MKRRFLFTTILTILTCSIQAQDVYLDWAKGVGGISSDNGMSVAVDSQGNVYVAGTYWGTSDFDPGMDTFNLTSNGSYDAFLLKLNQFGEFIWARSWGGLIRDEARSISISNQGNVYVTGIFEDTVDFDPGTGIFNLISNGDFDPFAIKLDENGNFIWAKSWGGKNDDESYSIATDSVGNVYITGYYNDVLVDFDPGIGIFNLTINGTADIF